MIVNRITHKLKQRHTNLEKIRQDEILIKKIEMIYNLFNDCFNRKNKIIFCGNGGSAADCQHIVAEFIVKLSKMRRSLPAISLTTNNSIITAISNDFDSNMIFTRQLEGIANSNDVLVGISTSGKSLSVIKAFEYARYNHITTLSVTGSTINKLSEIADYSLKIPSENTQIIQETYSMIFHIICELLDDKITQI